MGGTMTTSVHDSLSSVSGMDEFDEAEIFGKIHLIDTDILMLSGSLIDGSGTPSSDFDFCVIAREQDDRFHRETFPRDRHMRFYTSGDRVRASFDYLPHSLLGVDVEYWTASEIIDMLDAHSRLYQHMISRARKSSSFGSSGVDFRLLSRLTYGVPLQNADELEKIRSNVHPDEVAFTAFGTAIGSYPDFRDLVGMWEQADFECALIAARKLGGDTFRGLTHLYGNTNRNPKYLPRFLTRLPAHLADLVDRFRRLYAYGVGDPAIARDTILEWLDLIDLAYDEIRRVRDSISAVPSRDDFLRLLRSELHESMAWNAEIVNEYSFRAREAMDGLPRLREMVDAMHRRDAVDSGLPLQNWAAGRSAPQGENNSSSS
jgi:hypothetical protein